MCNFDATWAKRKKIGTSALNWRSEFQLHLFLNLSVVLKPCSVPTCVLVKLQPSRGISHTSKRSWKSPLPCGFLQLTLIHSNLAEEMREAISVYDELLSRLHFLCPSSSSCFSPPCLVLFEWDWEDFPAAWTLCYWILAAETPAADRPWVGHITYLQDYHISNSPCQLPGRLLFNLHCCNSMCVCAQYTVPSPDCLTCLFQVLHHIHYVSGLFVQRMKRAVCSVCSCVCAKDWPHRADSTFVDFQSE